MNTEPLDGIAGDIALVVGLGNPGPGYAGNRHNVGVMVVDLLATRMGSRFKTHKGGAEVLEGRLAGRRVVLARPRSYMNVSGGPVHHELQLAALGGREVAQHVVRGVHPTRGAPDADAHSQVVPRAQ